MFIFRGPYKLFLNIKTKSSFPLCGRGRFNEPLFSKERLGCFIAYREYKANTLKMAEYVVTID
jgi:hypothetical protein